NDRAAWRRLLQAEHSDAIEVTLILKRSPEDDRIERLRILEQIERIEKLDVRMPVATCAERGTIDVESRFLNRAAEQADAVAGPASDVEHAALGEKQIHERFVQQIHVLALLAQRRQDRVPA